MNSLIKMFILIFLLISMGLFASFTNNNNFTETNINYLSTGYFDNKKVVDSLINNKQLSDLIHLNEFQKIENELEKINSIRTVDIYRNTYLELEIDIIDREPIAILSQSNSYMDSSGMIIKKYYMSNDSLPEIKGIISDGMEFKILKVITALDEDIFFKNKLQFINLKGEDIFLNIKDFDFDIRLGNEFKLKNKLNMLKGFYLYLSNNSANKKYKQIDLVFNNQLIAIKK
tara:strand:+ start:221 stop:910 length:690 start_codon:yes stop_codon:yes gene_type:complete